MKQKKENILRKDYVAKTLIKYCKSIKFKKCKLLTYDSFKNL